MQKTGRASGATTLSPVLQFPGMEYKDIEVKLLRELSKEPFYAVHTREQAEGAWPNGTSVQKIQSAAEDKHQDGSRATVTGSLGPFTRDFIKDPPTPDDPHLELYFYFVEWEDLPGIPAGILSYKLQRRG